MKTIHFLNQKIKEKKETEKGSFLLANNKGDFLWLKEKPESRYEGWFCRLEKKLYRIIESIEPEEKAEITKIQNEFSCVKRKRDGLREMFYLPRLSHNLILKTDKKVRINVFLDVREAYDTGKGEDYAFYQEGGAYIAEFTNGIYLAVSCKEGKNIKKEIERRYPYDKKRNSPPFERTVYKGLSLYGKRFIFAVGKDKEEVIKEVNKIYIKEALQGKKELDVLCAENSLSGLLSFREMGIYAGLPWFFQFWPRDEAVSLKSLFTLKPQKAKEIYLKLLDGVFAKGPSGTFNADAPGWLFKRTDDALPFLQKEEKEKTRRILKKYIEESLWAFTEKKMAINHPHETWMDSLKRDGARIEMQAMRLNMYRLAAIFAKGREEKKLYDSLEKELRKEVRKIFFDGENLYDGYFPQEKALDKKIRPNIFIAAYMYPDLLCKREWTKCFDNALEKLWLPWGGLSTLQKDDNDFHGKHTGENPASYHQGDSWFFLNNLAAFVLYSLDKKRYESYIKKIMEASREELMWKGAIGRHAEISSAGELQSEGCVNQAWSSAMYLEARRKISFKEKF